MAFYVSAISGRKRLALGPFRGHGEALKHVDCFRRWAAHFTDVGFWPDVGYGTARHRTNHGPGKFNAHFGVSTDSDGFVTAVSRA
jgi:hypothetical protein